ncbi:MAG: hypothetical protein JNG86_09370 [Verrucomicrobiaceae bacterium]|nr:hypothetical protein [Verrucomicrobiaceae bacterium]
MKPPPAPDSGSTPPGQTFPQYIAQWRQIVATSRELLPPHSTFKPDWNRHLQRLDDLESLFQQSHGKVTPLLKQLHEDFILDYEADMALTVSETKASIVRFTDEIARRFEEKKFELPSEVRDDLEDVLQPYHDHFREQMLGELPIEERRAIEEDKRRLDEED